MQPRIEASIQRDIRRQQVQRDIVRRNLRKWSVDGRVRGLIVIQIQTARSFAQIVYPSQDRNAPGQLVDVVRIAAGYGSKFALADQAIAKVRIQRQIISAEETRKLQLAQRSEMPHVIHCQLARM